MAVEGHSKSSKVASIHYDFLLMVCLYLNAPFPRYHGLLKIDSDTTGLKWLK